MLQEREFERLGSTETIRANIRLVAATNKDLEKAIAAGEFREDLYYRLNVFAIFVPPLRERKPDILLLADHFVEKFSREHGKKVKRISTPAIDMLASYHWPGNVRELANAIERAVVVCDGQVAARPPSASDAADGGGFGNDADHLAERMRSKRSRRTRLLDALKSARGNRAKAARLLSTTERIFNYRVRKYGSTGAGSRPEPSRHVGRSLLQRRSFGIIRYMSATSGAEKERWQRDTLEPALRQSPERAAFVHDDLWPAGRSPVHRRRPRGHRV